MTNGQIILSYFLIFFMGLVLSFAAYNIGVARTEKQIQIDAVKNGCAEWIVDEDGQVKFEWRKLND